MRQVVMTSSSEVRIDEITKTKGYVMVGNKANFVLSKNTDGDFIWVRVTPGKIGKPIHKYSTMADAISDKIEKGYDVFEYDNALFE